ncbi:LysE family translocator [Streptomyces sp. NEAU-S77]|uniref:LysE family translocator n=1 Tax=Streptomyces sp. NEAU-S77 TaxID=3411033 RepID=UPI003BA249D7
MPPTDRLLAFAAMSFLLIVVPGPSVLFVIGRALAQGCRAALTSVLGNTLGAYTLVVAVALGVGTLVERSVLVFTALKLAGAAYLVYLGVKAIRRRHALPAALTGGGRAAHGSLRTLGEGFAVGVANPKTIVFFAAVLPQFVDRGDGHVALQMLLLGLVFNAIALASDSIWGVGGVLPIMPGSRRLARHLAAPRSSHAAPLRSPHATCELPHQTPLADPA